MAKRIFFDYKIQEIALSNKRLWNLMNWVRKQNYQQQRLSSSMAINIINQTIYSKPYQGINCTTLLKIDPLIYNYLMNFLHINKQSGLHFLLLSSNIWLSSIIVFLHQTQTIFHEIISRWWWTTPNIVQTLLTLQIHTSI